MPMPCTSSIPRDTSVRFTPILSSPVGIPCRWSHGLSRRRCGLSEIRNMPPATRPSAWSPMSTRAWRESSRGRSNGCESTRRCRVTGPPAGAGRRRWTVPVGRPPFGRACNGESCPSKRTVPPTSWCRPTAAIFFQALDENFREIQRERTYVNYLPGEVRSCTGCHGQSNRTASLRASAMPLALTRPPSTPQPQPCDLKANGGDGLRRPGHSLPHRHPADLQRQVRLMPRCEGSCRRAEADRRSHPLLQHLL